VTHLFFFSILKVIKIIWMYILNFVQHLFNICHSFYLALIYENWLSIATKYFYTCNHRLWTKYFSEYFVVCNNKKKNFIKIYLFLWLNFSIPIWYCVRFKYVKKIFTEMISFYTKFIDHRIKDKEYNFKTCC